MITLLTIVLSGFLVRADGWGTDNPRWQRAAKFFNAWSCAGLFAVLSAFSAPLLAVPAYGIAFLVWRLPGFDGWEDWLGMFWRGFWTSFIGFTLVSLAVNGSLYGGLLSLPFAALYMLVYSGGYKWLPQTILGFDRHVWIEHASGWLFSATILLVGI